MISIQVSRNHCSVRNRKKRKAPPVSDQTLVIIMSLAVTAGHCRVSNDPVREWWLWQHSCHP